MKIEEKLRFHGKKVTPERVQIYKKMNRMHLFESKDLIQSFPDIGRASIFRTLKLFLEIGVIRRVHLGEGSESYEIECCSNCRHEHMKCKSCGDILNFSSDLIYSQIFAQAKRLGFQVDEHSLSIFGRCKNCL